jgi:putative membrane protein
MLPPALAKNDRKAKWLIIVFSVFVFLLVGYLNRIKLEVNVGFDVHVFALFNAIVNSIVAVLLIVALIAVKQKKYLLHKKLMLTALVLSVLFLVSYICHHLLAGETIFGNTNHDDLLSEEEKAEAGGMRTFYYIILATHIPLAGLVLPFILFTAYRALIAEYALHKKYARIVWPVWFYVSLTGVLVYLLISPYY